MSGVLFLLVYTASRASHKRRIQIIHKSNLFHTSRFCKLSGKSLHSDRERYFFHVYERCRSYAEVECGWKKEKIHPSPPLILSHGRKLFMLDIATVNPLIFYETGSKCTEGYYTGANCCGFLTRGSLFILNKKSG